MKDAHTPLHTTQAYLAIFRIFWVVFCLEIITSGYVIISLCWFGYFGREDQISETPPPQAVPRPTSRKEDRNNCLKQPALSDKFTGLVCPSSFRSTLFKGLFNNQASTSQLRMRFIPTVRLPFTASLTQISIRMRTKMEFRNRPIGFFISAPCV